MDVTTVTAGLLHDVLEDTKATKGDLQREFGTEIADLVDGVTKIGKLAFSSREERQAENFRKMLVAMARDLRVLMIKLADRLHNMRTLEYLPTDKARKIAQETLDIYAPLAHRLGMAKVKAELEDLALRVLHPDDYQELMRRVAKRRLEREAEINHLIALLHEKLGEVGIGSKIAGRPKHFYSIWKKMHEGGREFDEIYDLTAVRVLTNTVRDCYGALGVDPLAVEAGARPLQGLHRDAQGQHVPVAAHDGHRPQGRSRSRSRSAPGRCTGSPRKASRPTGSTRRRGATATSSTTPSPGCASSWSRRRRRTTPRSSSTRVRLDLFPDEVYVFTPQGRRQGAARGRDAGRLRLRRAHRRRPPLRRRQGQRQAGPAALHAPPGRHRRDRHLAHPASEPRLAQDRQVQPRPRQDQPVAEDRGARPLARPSAASSSTARPRSTGWSPPTLLASDEMKKLIVELGFPTVDDLLASIGYGKTSIQQVLGKLAPAAAREQRRGAEAKPPEAARKTDGPRSGSAAWTTCSSASASAARRCPATASWASSRGGAA